MINFLINFSYLTLGICGIERIDERIDSARVSPFWGSLPIISIQSRELEKYKEKIQMLKMKKNIVALLIAVMVSTAMTPIANAADKDSTGNEQAQTFVVSKSYLDCDQQGNVDLSTNFSVRTRSLEVQRVIQKVLKKYFGI